MNKAKVLALVFCIFLIGCFSATQSSKPLWSDPNDFRGIKWGTEISTLKDMEKVEEDRSSDKDLVWYTRKGDTLAMGGAKLENIFYSFWAGKFDSVWIDYEGEENFEALKKDLFKRFGKVRWPEELLEKTKREIKGEPSPIKPLEGFYAWWGKNSEVVLSYSKERHKGTLTISSTTISEERKAYKKQKEKEERLKER